MSSQKHFSSVELLYYATFPGYLQQHTKHVSNYRSYWAIFSTCKVMKCHVKVTINLFKMSNIKILKLLTVNTVTPS